MSVWCHYGMILVSFHHQFEFALCDTHYVLAMIVVMVVIAPLVVIVALRAKSGPRCACLLISLLRHHGHPKSQQQERPARRLERMALRSCFVHQKVMIACSTQAPAPPRRPLTIASLNNQIPKSVLGLGAALTVGLGAFTVTPASAFARSNILPPIDFSDSERCLPSQLDKFAQTRAKFSLEAGSGDVKELLVDIRCLLLSGRPVNSRTR